MSRGGASNWTASGEFPSSAEALVPEGGVFEGQVAIAGPTRIDGLVRGTLRGPGALLIGPTGHVEGQISCAEVISQGTVTGPITAEERACLAAGAHFEGDLASPVLDVHDEAIWIGRAKVGKPTRS